MENNNLDDSSYVDSEYIQKKLSIGRNTIWRWCRTGKLPKPFYFSPGRGARGRWKVTELDEAIEKMLAAPKHSQRTPMQAVKPKIICCSFCGKDQSSVNKLIAGPMVWICNECTMIAYGICTQDD